MQERELKSMERKVIDSNVLVQLCVSTSKITTLYPQNHSK